MIFIKITISKTVLAKRLFVYCLGIFIMALGVSFSAASALGVSPVNSMPQVLSQIFTNTSTGTCIIIVFSIFLLLQLIILGRDFHPSRLLQLICSFMFGFFVDFTNWLTGLFLPVSGNYAVRLIYLCISMALIAMGILLYMAPNILPMPVEGVMQVISNKAGIPLHQVKIIFDASIAAIAAVISLIAFHYLTGVREGTVIAALGCGKFLGIFTKLFQNQLYRFIEIAPENTGEEKELHEQTAI